MRKKNNNYVLTYFFGILFILLSMQTHAQVGTPFQDRIPNGALTLKGNIRVISNNILNPSGATNSSFTGLNSNDFHLMEFIDIDNDDSTFSSSSATLTLPNNTCTEIAYAGLYWGGTYPFEQGSATVGINTTQNNNRLNDYKNVKFKVPGGSYIDITPTSSSNFEYTTIYDQGGSVDLNHTPYLNYANVTHLLQGLNNANGEYTVANVEAMTGWKAGGSTAGWTLVVIYKNPSESLKRFVTKDGFASVDNTNSTTLSFDSFQAVSNGAVNMQLIVGAMDGDRDQLGPQLAVKPGSAAGNTSINGGLLNPVDNFFSSTITTDFTDSSGRTPSNTNTLGWDTDLFTIPNPLNSLIANNETALNIEIGSTNGGSDQYYFFLQALATEIQKPELGLQMEAQDLSGSSLGNATINPGQSMQYAIHFQNIGNDDLDNTSISFPLPEQVALVDFGIETPPGVTWNHNPLTNVLVFQIPNSLVEQNDPKYEIIVRTKTEIQCSNYLDSCENIISAQSSATYSGLNNTTPITNQPSNVGTDSCKNPISGTTNFRMDLSNCNFTRTEFLCGASMQLTAGAGFASYSWTNNSGANIGNTQAITIATPGTYKVTVTGTAPCIGYTETVTVLASINNSANPISIFADHTETCPNDGTEMPQIFLCGANDSRLLNLNMLNAQSITWGKLPANTCVNPLEGQCPSVGVGCTYNTVASGSSFRVSEAGAYKIDIILQNGCVGSFFFHVFKNDFDPQIQIKDIFCNSPGEINLANLPANHEISLDGINWSSINPIPINIVGSYTLRIRPTNGNASSCDFVYPNIVVQDKTLAIEAIKEDILCGTNTGSIRIHANDAAPQYEFFLKQGANTIGSSGLIDDNTFTFNNLTVGTYTVEVKTSDGCTATENVTINNNSRLQGFLTHTKSIDCSNGILTMQTFGGTPPYNFAIKSKDGTVLFDENNPNLSAVQSSPIFDINAAGIYTILVIDSKNCTLESNPVAIVNEPDIIYTTTDTDIACGDVDTGIIEINVTNNQGYTIDFSIDGGTTFQSSGTFNNLARGNYSVLIRRQKNGGTCTQTENFTITGPDRRLTASVGLEEVAACDMVNGKAKVKVANLEGGGGPYEFSFSGGPFTSSNTMLLDPGTHTILIRDALGCVISRTIVIPPIPTAPNTTTNQSINCDGTGNIDVTVAMAANFDLFFQLDGVTNVPATSSSFQNIPPGNHTVTVNYLPITPIEHSILLFEDFGFGPNTGTTNIDPRFVFQDQATLGELIRDGEYSITKSIDTPYPVWNTVNDHGGHPEGRFLAINIGSTVGAGGIMYTKPINDIEPNRDLTITLNAFNLMQSSSSDIYHNPNIIIRLVGTGGTVVASIDTGDISKTDKWETFQVNLNPGNNTQLNLEIITNSPEIYGNDICLDDIEVKQLPKNCHAQKEINFTVEAGKDFNASVLTNNSISCNGANDGSVSIQVVNFDTSLPHQYTFQVDGGATSAPQTNSTFTVNNLTPGNHTVQVISNDGKCTIPVNFSINEPPVLSATTSVDVQATCNNSNKGTATATATGGTAPYEFRLVDTNGNPITGFNFQSSATINNISIGTFRIQVKDANNCLALSAGSFSINPPNPVEFTATPTACYLGNSQGAIVVNATNGNGNFQFQINGGPWQTPTPVNSTTFTFNNLTDGTFTINVKDSFGCEGTAQNISISPALNVSATVSQDLFCNADASININISGGTAGTAPNSYTLEVSQNGGAFGSSTNVSGTNHIFTTSNSGTFRFRVTDSNGCTKQSNSIIITPIVPLPNFTSITPTHLNCNGNNTGALDIVIDTNLGVAPYSLNITNTTTNTNFGTQTTGLTAGDYTITITDSKMCSSTQNVTITEPTAIQSNLTVDGISCTAAGEVLGKIHLNASGGTPPYVYTVSNPSLGVNLIHNTVGSTAHSFENLEFGSYLVTIRDANNCAVSSTEDITSPPNTLLTTSGTAGCDTGSITVQASTTNGNLGSGPFFFAIFPAPPFSATDPAWNASTGANSFTFNNLNPGVKYSFVVHDQSKNCEFVQEATVPIASISQLNSTISDIRNISCKGANDGRITINVTPTTGTTSVAWEVINTNGHTNAGLPSGTVPAFNTNFNIGGSLPPGKYYIKFTETGGVPSGCVKASAEFEITEVNEALIISATSTKNDSNCAAAGVIQATAQLGLPPYRFIIKTSSDPAPSLAEFTTSTNTTGLFSSLEAGSYIVYVRDATNCIEGSSSVTVALDPAPQISVSLLNPCENLNGSYNVRVNLDQAGINPQNLVVDGAAPLPITSFPHTINNLSAGTHSIQIIDQNGCGETETIEIFPPLSLQSNITKSLGCVAPINANLQIKVSGGDIGNGLGGFTFEVDGPVGFTDIAATALPAATHTLNTLNVPGSYTITVRNTRGANTCSISNTVIVAPPAAVIPSIRSFENELCSGAPNTGKITVAAQDLGNGPMQFRITSIDGTTVNISPTSFTNFEASFEGLEGGNITTGVTYTIVATSAQGCTGTITQRLTEPAPISIPDLSSTNFLCTPANGNTHSPATVSLNTSAISGGSGAFPIITFVYDNGTPANTSDDITQSGTQNQIGISNPLGGVVTATVTDDVGCTSAPKSITIAPLDQILTTNVTITEKISCANAGEDIQIAVTTATSDLSKIEYSADNGVNWQASNSFTDLSIGTHILKARHTDTNCVSTINHTVNNPNTLAVQVIKVNDAICNNTATGVFQIQTTDSNYSNGYSFTVLNATTNNPVGVNGTGSVNTLSNNISIAAGNYILSVTQNNLPNCTKQVPFQISNPPDGSLVLFATRTSEATCDNNKGAISANTTGGWGSTVFQLVNQTNGNTIVHAFSSTRSWSNLPAAVYGITAKDSAGCEVVQTVTISPPTPITLNTFVSGSLLHCVGDKTAIITATATGGSGNYQFELIKDGVSFGKQTTTSFTNLGAGNYSVIVTDNWNCKAQRDNILIIDPTPLRALATITSPKTCLQQATVTITGIGGTPPYTFGINSNTFINNPNFFRDPGKYTFFVRDANGCISSASPEVVVPEVKQVEVSIDPTEAVIACFGQSTARIKAIAKHGLGNYQYTLLDASNTVLAGPQNKNTFENIGSGTYSVRVTSSDCEGTSAPITITDPSPIVYLDPEVTHVDCNGNDNGQIRFRVTGGTGTIKYAKGPLFDKFDDTPVFTDLKPGDHEFIIVDANGCIPLFRTITITEPDPIEITVVELEEEICKGDQNARIRIDVNGGVPPYRVSFNSTNDNDFVANNFTIENQAGGQDIMAFVKDANDCLSELRIPLKDPIDLSSEPDIHYFCDETGFITNTVTITVNPDYLNNLLFTLDNDPATTQTNNVFSAVAPGEHTVQILHANGCEKTDLSFVIGRIPPKLDLVLTNNAINTIEAHGIGGAGHYTYKIEEGPYQTGNTFLFRKSGTYQVTIKDTYDCEITKSIEVEWLDIEIPPFFTPNGDGKNDTWFPKNMISFPDAIIHIYDRYGRKLYTFPYDGFWDGTMEDSNLPSGDYWYMIFLNHEEDARSFFGNFTLIR